MKQAQGARFIASFAKKPALSEVKGWGFGSCGIWLVWDLARVGFARVGRTLLSVAFDVDLDPDFDFDFDREGHGFSRAATRRQKKPGFSRRGKPHPIKGHSFRTGRQAR
jgi:hypothetical protein